MVQKQFQNNPFQFQNMEAQQKAPPSPRSPSRAVHDIKKFINSQERYLPLLYPLILLFLFIAILESSLKYKTVPGNLFPFRSAKSGAPRMAICLVGGARRFELTGPSILENVLNVFPEADLFVHTNLDENSFKLGLLRLAPHIAEVRIRRPAMIPETQEHGRLLAANSSPKGIQGLLQYFDLVEGCLDMIGKYESQGNFTYDWILRTRVDGYWMGPLDSKAFKKGSYVVPEGFRFGGLNDRLGIGNRSTSKVALSRLSLLPQLASAGLHDLNSEFAFRAQLTMSNISVEELRFPFCVLSDRVFEYPPKWYVPLVASMGSPGPVSGAYCRPCIPICKDECMMELGMRMTRENWWSLTEFRNGSLELCDPGQPWQEGWQEIFDKVAGKAAADVRRKVTEMKNEDCVREMEELKRKTERWNGPDSIEICNLGFTHTS